MPNKDKNQ